MEEWKKILDRSIEIDEIQAHCEALIWSHNWQFKMEKYEDQREAWNKAHPDLAELIEEYKNESTD